MDALRRLPDAQREAIALHHLADLPVHEVAATLGVPTGTVKARLSRGRAALATLLTEPPGRPAARPPRRPVVADLTDLARDLREQPGARSRRPSTTWWTRPGPGGAAGCWSSRPSSAWRR